MERQWLKGARRPRQEMALLAAPVDYSSLFVESAWHCFAFSAPKNKASNQLNRASIANTRRRADPKWRHGHNTAACLYSLTRYVNELRKVFKPKIMTFLPDWFYCWHKRNLALLLSRLSQSVFHFLRPPLGHSTAIVYWWRLGTLVKDFPLLILPAIHQRNNS